MRVFTYLAEWDRTVSQYTNLDVLRREFVRLCCLPWMTGRSIALKSATIAKVGSTELAYQDQVLQIMDLKEMVLHMLDVGARQTTFVTRVASPEE